MSQLTDDFIRKLLASGKSEEEASDILSNIIVESLDELYRAKNLDPKADQEVEEKLKYLLGIGAPKKQLYQTLAIYPLDLQNILEKKLNKYSE